MSEEIKPYQVSYVADKPSDVLEMEELEKERLTLEKDISTLNSILQRMFLAIVNSPENKSLAEAHVRLNTINKLLNK